METASNPYRLKSLFWEATLRCNAFCEFCGSRCGEQTVAELLKNEVEGAVILKCFNEISKRMDSSSIMLNVTGGEPLLRKDLFDVMSKASRMGFPWGMVTNGTLINCDIVAKMKDSGMKTISISLDGLPETHNELRKLPGGFQKIEQAVDILREADFLDELQITTVVSQKNIHELEQLFSVIKTWEIHSWRLVIVDPIGRAQDNCDILLTKEDLKKYFDFFEKHQFNGYFTLETSCSHYLGQYDNLYRLHDFSCDTGIHIASILANGDIFVCPNVPRRPELIQGNINTDSFVDIWENGFEWFRQPSRQTCQECAECPQYPKCKGDSLHTWDFNIEKPNVCFRNIFHDKKVCDKEEDDIKKRLLSYYSDMKGIKISYGSSSEKKLIFTPSATHDLMSFFSWGEKTPSNCFELLVGLAGFKTDYLTVVEHIIPSRLLSRSESTAAFSNEIYYELLAEVDLLNKGTIHCDEKYKLSKKFSFVGIAHSHPLGLDPALSVPDIQLHGQMQQKHPDFVSVLINPQKKQLAVFYNSVFTPINTELLFDNTYMI